MQRRGRLRAIGVSNYEVRHLQELLQYADIKPGAWEKGVRSNCVHVHACLCSCRVPAAWASIPTRRAVLRVGCQPLPAPALPHVAPSCHTCTTCMCCRFECSCRPAAAVNQVECHPRWQQRELRAFCQAHGIALVAYSSFGGGQLLSDPAVAEVAAAAGATPAQALLLWGLQRGCGVLPKSVRRERIEEAAPARLAQLGELGPEALAALDALEEQRRQKYCWDPSGIA